MSAAAPTANAAKGVNGAPAANGVNGARFPELPGDEAEQGIWACGDTPLPPQLWPPGRGAPGGGFGQDGVLDGMPPGPELGLLLPGAGDMAGLDDGELTGVARGWRRMGSWAAAMEHAAVAELARRRVAEAESCGARGDEVPRYAAAEVAAALTLTSFSADGLTGRALSLAGLPATWAALAAGRIDVPKALVILSGVSCLGGDLARAVEAQVVGGAGGQTTGELRKSVARAVIAADPAAADRRAAEAVKSARVERWAEPCGTAAIAGRDLPAAEALAAGNRVSALAAALKADGAPGGIDLLRAHVFLGLLLGRPVAAPAHGTPADTITGPGAHQAASADDPTGAGAPTPADPRIPADAPAVVQRSTPEQRPAAERRPTMEHASCAELDCPAGHDFGAGERPADAHDPATEFRAVPEGGRASGEGPASVEGSGAEEGSASGEAVAGQRPGAATAGPADPALGQLPAGLRRVAAGQSQHGWPPPGAGMAGAVNLTVPLRSLLGQSREPAEVSGFGPVNPSVASQVLAAARSSPVVRWCVTVTDAEGRAAGHGCAARAPAGGPGEPGGWAFTLTVRALESGECGHARESAAYKPPPLLRHLIQTRHETCTFPGCGRPARRCDIDHTIAYDDGGRTCECNLAPLCRFHHKVKQARGWQLKQRSPGVLQWVAPSGWRYTIIPSKHPI